MRDDDAIPYRFTADAFSSAIRFIQLIETLISDLLSYFRLSPRAAIAAAKITANERRRRIPRIA